MPYDVVKRSDGAKPYKVVKQGTGEVLGEHKTRISAVSQMRAIYANSHEQKPTPGMMHGGSMILDDTYTPQPITSGFMDGRKVNIAPPGPPKDEIVTPAPPETVTEAIDAAVQATPLGTGLLEKLKGRKKKE